MTKYKLKVKISPKNIGRIILTIFFIVLKRRGGVQKQIDKMLGESVLIRKI